MSWLSTFLRGKVFSIAMSECMGLYEMGNYLQGSMWGLNVYLNLIVNKGHSPVIHPCEKSWVEGHWLSQDFSFL